MSVDDDHQRQLPIAHEVVVQQPHPQVEDDEPLPHQVAVQQAAAVVPVVHTHQDQQKQ